MKLPIQAQAILHYDDAETLYHVLSMRYGRVPHLEDASHHSLGYILPFYLLSFFFGFSEFLLRQSAFIIQALAALGVFLTVRIYQKRDSALITSLLFLSAREPWVNAFYPQYIFNLIFVWVLYFLVTDIHANRFKLSRYAFLLCGIGFVFDQRLLFLTILPLCLSFTGLNLISLKNSLKGIL
ncbi:MAG: hypothetical protein KDD56_06525, partial [Bdellovibrionales bacterium]|nr:hypothetical protein [Bdellovibrionales bacterium]